LIFVARRSTRDHKEIRDEVRSGKRRLVEEDVIAMSVGSAGEASPGSTPAKEELGQRSSSSSSKLTLQVDAENADPQQIAEAEEMPTSVSKPDSNAGSLRKGSSLSKAPLKRTRTEKSSLSERA
jgi:hypothetical protein